MENDLQTDPENHLHQPHPSTPIITLSPPTVMNLVYLYPYIPTPCAVARLATQTPNIGTLGAE